MSRKRLFSLVFLVLFVLLCASLSFAGGQKDTGGRVEGGSKAVAVNLDTIEGQKAWLLGECKKANINWQQFKGQSITIAMNRHWYTDALDPFIATFEELTGMRVFLEIYSEEEFYTKLAIDLAAKGGIFDAFMQGCSFLLAQYSEAGWLEPLDAYLNNSALTDLKWWDLQDFNPGIDAGKYDLKTHRYGTGTQFALPVSFECQVVLYRKDLFDKLGIPTVKTMDDLMAAAGKIHDPTSGIYGIANRGRKTFSGMWGFAGFFRSWGGEWLDNNWSPTLNSKAGAEALKFYTDLGLKYGPPGIQNIDWYECQTLIQTGKVGIVTDASGWISAVVDPKKSQTYDKVAVSRFPTGPVKSEPNMWYWEMAMNKNSKHKDPTWLFLMWANSKATGLVTALSHGAPPRTGTWSDTKFKELMGKKWPPGYVDAVEWGLKNSSATSSLPAIKEGPELGDAFGTALNAVFDGKPVQASLDEAAESFTKILKTGGYK